MNIVVGAGWSGLAAAVELTRRGQPVTLIEAAATAGGRARTISHHGETLDNGQHLLLGACAHVRYLTGVLGLDESALFDRRPLDWTLIAVGQAGLRMRLPRLPAPFHLLAGLSLAAGLSLRDRLATLRVRVLLRAPLTGPDRSVATLLAELRQTPRLIDGLWRPLCLATLNTPIESASARVFARVLRDAFTHRRADSDLLLPRKHLGALLPEPAQHYLQARGATILMGRRVTAIDIDDDRITGIRLDDGRRLAAGHLILAVPPVAAARLLAPHQATAALAARLRALEHAPIITITLDYPPAVRLPQPMTGFTGGLAQWAFDHAIADRPGRIAIVLSAAGDCLRLDHETLAARVAGELATHFPDWPPPAATHVIREKHATFACTVGIEDCRPPMRTPLTNCLLAGDAVANGWPATLEGAVVNGLAAARAITEPTPPA